MYMFIIYVDVLRIFFRTMNTATINQTIVSRYIILNNKAAAGVLHFPDQIFQIIVLKLILSVVQENITPFFMWLLINMY